MNNRVHLLVLRLCFPNGLAPGAGGAFNYLRLARNGRDEPVLRGTSLAGVLRNAYSRAIGKKSNDPDVSRFFGDSLDEKKEHPSAVRIPDCILNMGQAQPNVRTHHLRNRHSKAVADGGLFSLESCPPGTTAEACVWILEPSGTALDDSESVPQFAKTLVSLLSDGLTVGGNSARGIGKVELGDGTAFRSFQLDDLNQHAAYLDAERLIRLSRVAEIDGLESLSPTGACAKILNIEMDFQIPRGQDLLVADGQGLGHQLEPQRLQHADGKDYWRIPGSTFRGLFRSWMTKLAAKEGLPVADSFARNESYRDVIRSDPSASKNSSDAMTGENLGRCFLPKEEWADVSNSPREKIECPIASLFGSLFASGRIFFSDALSLKDSNKSYIEQTRMHVAVDRITGGAAESMLFDNAVLVAEQPERAESFKLTIRVENPSEAEVRWLRKTIIALDLGLLRIGSSKSAGRIELRSSPQATGPLSESLNGLAPHHKN